jgi:uncharacterized membrane protein YcjF (UPF0283 family)
MAELTLLAWLTQLGLSIALPLGGSIWLSVWLRDTFELGDWVVLVGAFLGLYCAVYGTVQNIKALSRIKHSKKNQTKEESKHEEKKKKAVFFNDHD